MGHGVMRHWLFHGPMAKRLTLDLRFEIRACPWDSLIVPQWYLTTSPGVTALHYAAASGSSEILGLLLGAPHE